MQLTVQRVTKGLSIIAFISLLGFVIIGHWLLGLWGAEFKEAYWKYFESVRNYTVYSGYGIDIGVFTQKCKHRVL